MKYEFDGKTYEIADDRIDKAMDTLDISLAEACEMILADDGLIKNEIQEELQKTAEKAPRRYEQGAKPRKKAQKERKIDFEKGYLLEIMRKAIEEEINPEDFWVKTETELNFTYNNNKYTVKLTKHRPKK